MAAGCREMSRSVMRVTLAGGRVADTGALVRLSELGLLGWRDGL